MRNSVLKFTVLLRQSSVTNPPQSWAGYGRKVYSQLPLLYPQPHQLALSHVFNGSTFLHGYLQGPKPCLTSLLPTRVFTSQFAVPRPAALGWQSSPQIHHSSIIEVALKSHKSNVIPRSCDHLGIVTDGSVTKRGLRTTQYVTRHDPLHLAGFYRTKLHKHQVTCVSCEAEALSIAAVVRHFSSFIIQSKHRACVVTDGQPCVQTVNKLAEVKFLQTHVLPPFCPLSVSAK